MTTHVISLMISKYSSIMMMEEKFYHEIAIKLYREDPIREKKCTMASQSN